MFRPKAKVVALIAFRVDCALPLKIPSKRGQCRIKSFTFRKFLPINQNNSLGAPVRKT